MIASMVVAGLHVVFAAAESVGWSAFARRMGYDAARIEATRALALNQGAYNLGIAAVLGWAIATDALPTVKALLVFIIAMAIVGGLSVRWTIFVVQGVPAVLALGLLLAADANPRPAPVSAATPMHAPQHPHATGRTWAAPRFTS